MGGWGGSSQATWYLPWGPEVQAAGSPQGLAFPEGKGRGKLGWEGAWQPHPPSPDAHVVADTTGPGKVAPL